MANRPSKKDWASLTHLERWRQSAQDGIDDIRGWRNVSPDKMAADWGTSKDLAGFRDDTAAVVAAITKENPQLGIQSVRSVFGAIQTWHRDQNASNLPDDTLLMRDLEDALFVVQTVWTQINGRVSTRMLSLDDIAKMIGRTKRWVEEPIRRKKLGDPDVRSKGRRGHLWREDRQEIRDFVAELGPIAKKADSDKVSGSREAKNS